MGDLKLLGERIRLAIASYALQNTASHTTDPEEYREALASAMLRQDPIPRETVLKWMDGTEAPNLETLMEIGRLAGYENQASALRQLAYGADLQVYGLNEDDYNAYFPGPKLDIRPIHPHKTVRDR